MKTLVANIGAGGRMGRAVTQLLVNHPDLELATAYSRPGGQYIGHDSGILAGRPANGILVSDDLDDVLTRADVAIDFSHADLAVRAAETCARLGKRLVCGTTGMNPEQHRRLLEAASATPLLYAPNMSVGVNLVYKMLELAASRLGEDYDLEITEMHHRHKRDAPSGTALKLLEMAAGARGRKADEVLVPGRTGIENPREPGEIGISSIRAGETVGEHTVFMANSAERIELTHRAMSRDAFAGGALRAATWIREQPAGLYSMADVLGF